MQGIPASEYPRWPVRGSNCAALAELCRKSIPKAGEPHEVAFLQSCAGRTLFLLGELASVLKFHDVSHPPSANNTAQGTGLGYRARVIAYFVYPQIPHIVLRGDGASRTVSLSLFSLRITQSSI